jgi:cysteine-rich repeat protein
MGYPRLILAFMLAVLAPATPALAGPAVTFLVLPQSGCGPNNVEGWEFHTSAGVTVSALGVYDHQRDGLEFSIPVGLYDASCELLGSVAIPAGTSAALLNGYRYVGIPPLALSSGQTFRVAAVMRCDDFTPDVNSLKMVSLDPALTGGQTRRIAGGSSLACPTQTTSVFAFGPNFLIGPPCGNGVVQAGEECDDGNTAGGDCCSPTCGYEPQGDPCPADDEVCSDDICDATGTCTHPAHLDGTPCTDDGLYCSGAETCQNGSCTSGGDPCTIDVCDETADQCVTPSPTTSATPTPTATATSVATNTVTRTTIATVTPIATSTRTGTVTPTQVASPTPPLTATATAIATSTRTGAATATSTRTRVTTPTGAASPTPPLTATTTPLTATAIATVTPSSSATISPSPTATDGPAPCVGDCDGSATVSIGELVTGVSIALGLQSIDRCPAFDLSANGGVEINELISAVNNALNGCP